MKLPASSSTSLGGALNELSVFSPDTIRLGRRPQRFRAMRRRKERDTASGIVLNRDVVKKLGVLIRLTPVSSVSTFQENEGRFSALSFLLRAIVSQASGFGKQRPFVP